MEMALDWAFVAGAAMFLGYVLYIFLSFKRDVDPNPLTWLMFSYGTVLLTVLEADQLGVFDEGLAGLLPRLLENMNLLLLPIACSIGGIVVAILCFTRGKMRWPEDRANWLAFGMDFAATVGYLAAWAVLAFGFIQPESRVVATLVFLVLSNISAIPAFVPILRDTRKDARTERALPWIVWTSSYIILAVITYREVGLWSGLMIYPVLNTVLHGTMALLALPHRRTEKDRTDDQQAVELELGFKRFGDIAETQGTREEAHHAS